MCEIMIFFLWALTCVNFIIFQAQFISAVRTALDINAGPSLLDAGLQLSSRV